MKPSSSDRRPHLAALLLVGASLALLGLAAPALAGVTCSSDRGAVFTATNATADDGGNRVLAYRRNARGRLSFLGSTSTGGNGTGSGLGNQSGITLTEDAARLLVVNAGSDTVSVLGVAPRRLLLLDEAPSGGTMPISVTVQGELVYVLNAGGGGSIVGFELAENGSLTPLAGSVRPLSGSGTAPAQIGFSPDGRVLAVTEKGTNTIVTYVIGDDGLPGDPIVTTSEGTTPFGFAFGHRGRLLVSEANGGGPSTASSYEVLPDGYLEPITSALELQQSAACWLVVTRNGRTAYTTNTQSDSISGLAVDRAGNLSLLQSNGKSADAGDAPIDAALSRDSRFLYVLNGGDDTLSAYAVSRNGSLRPLPGVSDLPPASNGLAAF